MSDLNMPRRNSLADNQCTSMRYRTCIVEGETDIASKSALDRLSYLQLVVPDSAADVQAGLARAHGRRVDEEVGGHDVLQVRLRPESELNTNIIFTFPFETSESFEMIVPNLNTEPRCASSDWMVTSASPVRHASERSLRRTSNCSSQSPPTTSNSKFFNTLSPGMFISKFLRSLSCSSGVTLDQASSAAFRTGSILFIAFSLNAALSASKGLMFSPLPRKEFVLRLLPRSACCWPLLQFVNCLLKQNFSS